MAPTVAVSSSLSNCLTSSHTLAAWTGVDFTATRAPTRASIRHCGGSLSEVPIEIDTGGWPRLGRFPRASLAAFLDVPDASEELKGDAAVPFSAGPSALAGSAVGRGSSP